MGAALDWSGTGATSLRSSIQARARAAFDSPDTLDHLIEIADMVTMQAAQRLIGSMRCGVRRWRMPPRGPGARRTSWSGRCGWSWRRRCGSPSTPRADDRARRGAGAPLPGRAGLAGRRADDRAAREILVDAVDQVEPELRDAVLARALELAEAEPVGTFRRALRTLIDTARAATLASGTSGGADPAGRGRARGRRHGVAADARPRGGTARHPRPGHRDSEGPRRSRGARPAPSTRSAPTCSRPAHRRRHPAAPAEARGIRATVVVTVPVLALLDDRRAATRSRPWSRASARSRSIGPGNCAAARSRAADPHPPRDRDGALRRPRRSTGHPPRCGSSRDGGPTGAWHPDAGSPPPDATSTTPSPGNTAATPHSRTWRRSARATTSSNTTAAGRSDISTAAAAPSNGPHPPAAATSSNPRGESRCSERTMRGVTRPPSDAR